LVQSNETHITPRSAALLRSFQNSQALRVSSPTAPVRNRSPSPLAADLQNPDTAPQQKRPRYLTDGPHTDSPANLRASIRILQERNSVLAEKNQELQKENKNLTTELSSVKTLWTSTASELRESRQSRQTPSSITAAEPGSDNANANAEADQSLAAALKEDILTYRELTKHVYARFKAAELAQISSKAVREDLDEIQETMQAVLGPEWKAFEKEIKEMARKKKISG
jgi:hypothetical protein